MILNIAPMFDMPTEYSTKWNIQLMEELNEKHTSLLAEDAVRWNFEDHIKEFNPELIVFYDHGDKQGLLQQGGDGYVIDKRNDSILRGREIYTMACLWGSDGGADAYRKGATAVWAYTKVFSFTTTEEEMFGHLGNLGLVLRRKKHLSWEDCVSHVKDAYNEKIEELREGGNPWTIMALVGNRDALVCWTDANQPSSDCVFRNMGIRLMGKTGQRLSRITVGAVTLFLVSWGVTLHAAASELYAKGGYREVLSFQGEWIGLAGMFIAIVLLSREHCKWLGKT